MKHILSILLVSLYCSILCAEVEDYVWVTPSHDSSESMPLGGGDIGMNVWVDSADLQIKCLVSQSGWFDENNTLLKAGLLNIQPENGSQAMIEQRLCTKNGSMQIRFEKTLVTLWVDVMKPVIHIEADQPITVKYENWRNQNHPINRYVNQQSSWKWVAPSDCYTRHDSIMRYEDGSVTFWHQNEDSTIFDYTVHLEQFDAYHDSIYNPLKNRIMGGRLIRHSANHWSMTLCCQQSSLDEWQKQLAQTCASVRHNADQKETQRWWNNYWQRSFIESTGRAHDALRNYTLFRYMYGCNAHPAKEGERWPMRINGGLFTFHPSSCDSLLRVYSPTHPNIVTYDFRRWGGGVQTAQNQRLLYWPMLQTGDWDALQGQLDFYSRIIPAGRLRSLYYWDHDGTCFTEQMENYGLPNPAEYGKRNADPGIENNRWLEYQWDTQLEFADMYCQMPFDRSPHGKEKASQAAREMILYSLRFFDEHYKQMDPLGHKVFYPGSACETYKITRNASPTVGGLMRLIDDALARKKDLGLTDEDIKWLETFRSQLPPIPTYTQKGKTCIAPAETWERIQNIETPQLYAVWPWRVTNRELGLNTWENDSIVAKFYSHIGWKQYNIWAAMLGLTDEAWKLTMAKLTNAVPAKNAIDFRFPAFWGPGYDWAPDFNWGGSAMIGLHAMLMQEDNDGNIILLPAWPREEDVHFRLWASGNRQVEVVYQGRKIISYTINGKKINPPVI